MGFMNIIIITLAVCAYIALRIVAKKMTVKRKIVYAGHPSSGDIPNIDISPLPQNDPKYTIGNDVVNKYGLEQMVVKGKSLEHFGIKDGAIVFVRKLNPDEELNKLIGRFIVFKIDNERTLREYPLKNIIVAEDGLKLRKVVKLLSKEEANVESQIKNFLLENDNEFVKKTDEEREKEYERYIKKYRFASDYYKNTTIIMSITYRNGLCKDYSFHSPEWLYGVVEYNTK